MDSAEFRAAHDTIGRPAYEAYRAKAGGVSLVSGAQLPDWEALDEKIKDAWDAAAYAGWEAKEGA
jgi:hypothetical protein